ncbi:MAG: hypothetical protein EA366_07990 [Spirulina sp. DLM2.Bin59]|nr:MAG: hypothetical protein EA366_07990 [Spirulina sp. DLM2.Bin59]
MLKALFPTIFTATALLATVMSSATAQEAACGPGSTVTSTPTQCVGTAHSQALSCNAIPNSPSHRMRINNPMAVEIKATGNESQPTLMINGPDGCFYAMATRSGGTAKIPGLWSAGEHTIYVGDASGAPHRYQLVITPD